jgi:hypothetical protein
MKLLVHFIFNLCLLYVSVTFTQLIHSEGKPLKLICHAFEYVSYYSLIACLVWLFAMCDDVWNTLNLYKRSPDIAYDELMQTSFISERRKKILGYNLYGFVVPSIVTIIALVTNEVVLKSDEFCWSSRKFTNLEFIFIVVPVIISMITVVFKYVRTGYLLHKLLPKNATNITKERIDLENKRLVIKFKTLDFILYFFFFILQIFNLSATFHGCADSMEFLYCFLLFKILCRYNDEYFTIFHINSSKR